MAEINISATESDRAETRAVRRSGCKSTLSKLLNLEEKLKVSAPEMTIIILHYAGKLCLQNYSKYARVIVEAGFKVAVLSEMHHF